MWSHWGNVKYDTPLIQGAIKIVYLGGEDKKGWVWVIPISSDNLSIGIVVNNSYLKREKEKLQKDVDWKEKFYANEIENSPALKKLLANAQMSHKVQVTGDYSYFCEKSMVIIMPWLEMQVLF